MRRARTVPAAVSIAFFAASANESGLVPITSVTRYTLPAMEHPPPVAVAGDSLTSHVHSTVHREHGAGDVARRVRAQEVHDARYLVRPPEPAERDLLLAPLHRLLGDRGGHVGLDEPRRDAVDG